MKYLLTAAALISLRVTSEQIMRIVLTLVFLIFNSHAWALTEQEKMSICFSEVERSVSSIKIISEGWESVFGEKLKARELSDFMLSSSLVDGIVEVASDVLPSTPLQLIDTDGLSLETQAMALTNIFEQISRYQTSRIRLNNLAYAMQQSDDEYDLADAKAKYVTECIAAINRGKHSKNKPAATHQDPNNKKQNKSDYLQHLRSRIYNCWSVNVGTKAAKVTVTVGMELKPDGKIVPYSIKMKTYKGGTEDDAKIAFQAVRRAALRCQKSGFYLPKEHFENWKYVELTFDPNEMRKR